MKLKDKVAIVTGSGRGTGKAIALAYARDGARLVIADINSRNAADVAQEINDSISEAIAVETDVSKEDSVAQMVSKADDRFGKVDILVANAAIQQRFFVHEFPVDVFRETLDVNIVGAFNCCKAVLAICPGAVKTKMSDTVLRPNGQHYDSTHFMEPEEIADVALFLASEASRALHGQSINVYGGVNYR